VKPVRYTIHWALQARDMLLEIADRRVRAVVFRGAEGLASEPEKQGKALTGDLAGLRSLRTAAGQRYRIIYRVERDRVLVLIVALGLRREGDRKDIYSVARKLIRLRLLDHPDGT
jgi:mRNA interferase RelE/StbE